MAAILAPHVNAYKRLQPDMLNGYWANWGHDDRSVGVRVPPTRGQGTRIEQRTSDAAANPYLAAAAILHAARLGVEHEMELPSPQPVGEAPNTESPDPAEPRRRADGARRPTTSWSTALGREMVEAFTILKRAEWERYLAAGADPDSTEVTPWEIDYYLPFH